MNLLTRSLRFLAAQVFRARDSKLLRFFTTATSKGGHELDAETERRWREVCKRRWGSGGYASLSPFERTWLNVRSLIDSIQNGGAISYFYNSGADNLGDCLEDLRALEATDVRSQIERICGLFPAGVPTDREERNEVINSWEDSEQYRTIDALVTDASNILMPLMDDLEEKLKEHLRRNGLAT